MLRVVRSPEGKVGVDLTGKRSGRGTYVCPRPECWSLALRSGSLTKVLKTEISADDRAELERFAAALNTSPEVASA